MHFYSSWLLPTPSQALGSCQYHQPLSDEVLPPSTRSSDRVQLIYAISLSFSPDLVQRKHFNVFCLVNSENAGCPLYSQLSALLLEDLASQPLPFRFRCGGQIPVHCVPQKKENIKLSKYPIKIHSCQAWALGGSTGRCTMYSQLTPEFPYLMPALLLAPSSPFMCQSWVVNKGPQRQFSTPPFAALAWWSSTSLEDVLSIIWGPPMKSELM